MISKFVPAHLVTTKVKPYNYPGNHFCSIPNIATSNQYDTISGSQRRDSGSQRRQDSGSQRRDNGSQRQDSGSQRQDSGSQRRYSGSQRRDSYLAHSMVV